MCTDCICSIEVNNAFYRPRLFALWRLECFTDVFCTPQERACEHLEDSPLLFSAPQCVGYSGEKGPLPREACLPQGDTVLAQLKRVVRALKARTVFVASDNDHMLPAINKALEPLHVRSAPLRGDGCLVLRALKCVDLEEIC